MLECPYCLIGVTEQNLDAHIARCPAARRAGAVGPASPERCKDAERCGGGSTAGQDSGDAPREFPEAEVARVECSVCGRKFAPDRITKHQEICQRQSDKRSRRAFESQRVYCEGGSEGRVVALSRGAHAPPPQPVKTTWREQSMALQEGCRAARRQGPLPRWGQDSAASPGGSRAAGRANLSQLSPGRGMPRHRLGGGFVGVSGRALPTSGPPSRLLSPRSGPSSPIASPQRGAPRRGQKSVEPSSHLQQHHRPEETARLKSEFRRLDANGDGTLDARELGGLLRAGDPQLSDREIQILFKQVDRDGNGRIDFCEFVDYIFCQPRSPTAPSRSKQRVGNESQAWKLLSPAHSSGGAAARQKAKMIANSAGSSLQLAWSGDPRRCGRDCMTFPSSEGRFSQQSAWGGSTGGKPSIRPLGAKSSLHAQGRLLAVGSDEG